MKSKLFLFVAIIPYVLLCGSMKKQEVPYIIDFKNRFVKISDTYYVDKYEVTIKDYKLFLTERKEKGLDNSLVMYDSTLWEKTWESTSYGNKDYYFNDDLFQDHPVVGISYYSAIEFCRWLTDKYNSSSKKQYKKVLFRLPTEEEFIRVASSGFDIEKIFYPWGNNTLYDQKKDKLCNFTALPQENLMFIDRYELRYGYYNTLPNNSTQPVASYGTTPYGVFDIVGNVSEMVQIDSIAMGGDFLSLGYEVRTTSKKIYKDKDITVGFRVYMEILEF
ncbi:MAG: formylglycine-generating enzyme family protein [Bacteroidales bacterium]|jgi:formylglycine-generating enzyme required for sulfatase activity|nr:formylglycine-generating enzyme family protein [Bacteroidales bacterium]